MFTNAALWHPVFVHFTFALLFLAPLFMLAGLGGRDSRFQAVYRTGRRMLWTGALFAVATVIAGFVAMNSVSVSAEVHAHIHSHRNWALGAALLYLVLACWSWLTRKRETRPGWIFGLLMFAALGLLLVAAYEGGELVFEHGVAVGAAGG